MTLEAEAYTRLDDTVFVNFDDPDIAGHDRKRAIIVDLDGTLAVHNGSRDPYDWKSCGSDEVDQVVRWITRMAYDDGYSIVICSGRPERSRDICVEWLVETAHLDYEKLFLRKDADFRSDDIVKEEIYVEKIQPYFDVRFVLDDRQQVVDMWRRVGLKCLQVAKGDF